MTYVKCDTSYCLNNKDEVCQLREINLTTDCYGFVCESMNDITEGADYKNVFYKMFRRNEDNTFTKEKCMGKRIEYEELVFFTMYDYRREDAPLTEEKSGVLACHMADLKNAAKMEFVRESLAAHFKTHKPVIEYEDRPKV